MVYNYVNIIYIYIYIHIYIYTHRNGGCITFFLNPPLTSKSDQNCGALRAIHQQTDQNGGSPNGFPLLHKDGEITKGAFVAYGFGA